jgi:ParB family chromosome partitioning protein
MQSTSSTAAAEGAEVKSAVERVSEKLAEKRRALGRGLESLLPGPRVVPGSEWGREPTRDDRASGSPVGSEGGRAGTAVSPAADGEPPSSVQAPSTSSGQSLATAGGTPALQGGGRPGGGAAAVVDLQAVASGRTTEGEPVYELPLNKIRDNPNQTRLHYDKEQMAELAASIAVQGVIQPIVVRPAGGGEYFLILGERRLRASQMAGKTTIPVIVRRVSEQQAAEMTITENLQRQDLGCIEQAGAFAMLSLRFHMTQDEIGKRVGLSREAVSNYLRLLKLPPEVIRSLQKDELSYSHARVLLRVTSDELISKLAQQAIEKAMSVQQLEDEVERATWVGGAPREEEKPRSGGARWQDPNVRAAQRSLEAALGMRVRIRDRKGKGKIVIEYSTLEDFDRVVKMLKGK